MTDYALYVVAVVFFVVAAVPHGLPIRFEWLAAACVVATFIN